MPIQTKPDQTSPNQMKTNQIKPNAPETEPNLEHLWVRIHILLVLILLFHKYHFTDLEILPLLLVLFMGPTLMVFCNKH